MQNRVAGMASSRAGWISTPHTSHLAVVAGLEATEGPCHLAEGVLQLAGQDLGLPTLGRDLAGVREVGVVGQAAPSPKPSSASSASSWRCSFSRSWR